MILGRVSKVFTYSGPESVENGNQEHDIYLFFDIEDATGKTHIACREKYQPDHRFSHFRENQDLEVFIAPKTIKVIGEPNVYGAITVRENKSYDQNVRHPQMTKSWMQNPHQLIETSGGISTDHSSKKEFESNRCDSEGHFENNQKEDEKLMNGNPEICKNLHLEHFISENNIDVNYNKAINAQEDQSSDICGDWSFSSLKELEERSEQFSEIDENSSVGHGYNFEMLKAKILSMSKSQEWDSAKEEWKLVHLYRKRNGKCPCNHYPITDHCVIKNQENGNKMFLGNCCIRHINEAQRKRAQKIWQIFRDPKVRANQDLIDDAFSQGYITEDEKKMYEALPKRKRTDTQNQFMLELNMKIIRNWDAKKTKCAINPFHFIEICYESSDQALYYQCTECEYKIRFHEGKEKNLEGNNPEAEKVFRREEDHMEEEFEGRRKTRSSCVGKETIQGLFDDGIISSESSSDQEDVSQDENFVPSQSGDEEEDSLDGDTSEDENSLTSESPDDDEDSWSYSSSRDEGLNQQAFRNLDSLHNRESHSNSDKFIYGEDGEALYQ